MHSLTDTPAQNIPCTGHPCTTRTSLHTTRTSLHTTRTSLHTTRTSLHYTDIPALHGHPCTTWTSLHYTDIPALHGHPCTTCTSLHTTWTSLHYMHIPAHYMDIPALHAHPCTPDIPALHGHPCTACGYGNTPSFMYVFYTHTSSITCFAHTHACTLGPRPLQPPRGVVQDLQYIHSTDANRRDFIILLPCTSHHFLYMIVYNF